MNDDASAHSINWFYATLLALSITFGFIGLLLIIAVDIETVLSTGPIECVLGLLIFITAYIFKHKPGMLLGAMMPTFVCGLTLLTLILSWSPQEAFIPFICLITPFLLVALAMTVAIFRNPPRRRHDWQCPNCSYAIYGLSSNQCPECGYALNPELVERFREATP